jgi:hypothetical protein
MAPAADVTWTKLASPLFPGRWVTRITVDQDDPNIAWASFSGWRSGDGYPHVLMTTDGANTWVDIVGKRIPQAPAINDIDLPDGSNTLYAATYGRSVWTTQLDD